LHTTPKNSDTKNYFFGLKSDGSPYFKINGNYSSIIDITYETSDKTRTNGEIINLIINNKPEKEYLMSVGKTNNNIELFDFEENKVIILSSFEDLTGYTIIAKSFTLFNFMDNNNNYYSILSFIGKENSNYFFVLQKFEFIYNSTNDTIENNRISFNKTLNLDKNHLKYSIPHCYY
jgi:hypothetical protein